MVEDTKTLEERKVEALEQIAKCIANRSSHSIENSLSTIAEAQERISGMSIEAVKIEEARLENREPLFVPSTKLASSAYGSSVVHEQKNEQ